MKKNERLYRILKKYDYDMAVFCQPENVVYASGMVTLPNIYAAGFFNWGMPLSTVILNVREEKEILYLADSVAGGAEQYSFADEIRTYHPYDLSILMNPAEEYAKGIREILGDLGVSSGKIAVEPGLLYTAGKEIFEVLKEMKVCDASLAIFESKMVKVEWEIARMKKAAEIVDAAFERLNQLSHTSGLDELEMWKEVFGAMTEEKGGHVHLSGELVTGPRSFSSSYPGGPIHRRTEAGDVGIMDMSARFAGYWCDCCNIVSFGKRNEKQRKYFEIIHNAYNYMKEALKPGVIAGDVYRASEKAYIEAGFQCPHYIGHSIGSGLNDLPKIIPCDNTTIEEGMCFSMEPGIYQENMGLRIEKMLYVTENGCEEFNKFNWGVYEWDK